MIRYDIFKMGHPVYIYGTYPLTFEKQRKMFLNLTIVFYS